MDASASENFSRAMNGKLRFENHSSSRFMKTCLIFLAVVSGCFMLSAPVVYRELLSTNSPLLSVELLLESSATSYVSAVTVSVLKALASFRGLCLFILLVVAGSLAFLAWWDDGCADCERCQWDWDVDAQVDAVAIQVDRCCPATPGSKKKPGSAVRLGGVATPGWAALDDDPLVFFVPPSTPPRSAPEFKQYSLTIGHSKLAGQRKHHVALLPLRIPASRAACRTKWWSRNSPPLSPIVEERSDVEVEGEA